MTDTYQPGRTRDEIEAGDIDAHLGAVLTDDAAIGNLLLAAERAGLDDDSPLVASVTREEKSRVLREARKNGQQTSMAMATGLAEQAVDASGYDMLINRVTPAAQQVLIKGEKGSGKTVLGLDLVRRVYAEFDGDLEIATNIKGPDEHDAVTFVETMSGLLEWVRDTKGEKIALMDEWSTTMNAHAHPGGQVRQTVSRFVNALRKGRGGSTRLVIIGHQHDSDIAAILRKQADVVVEKAGKADEGLADQAAVYDGWEPYVQQDHSVKVRGLQDVSEDSVWGADTNYFAYFEPDLDAPRKQIQRGKLIEDWEQYQDDAADDPGNAGEDAAETYVQCRGSKTDGSDCNATVTHVSGYCHAHRSQWDGDPDPRME